MNFKKSGAMRAIEARGQKDCLIILNIGEKTKNCFFLMFDFKRSYEESAP